MAHVALGIPQDASGSGTTAQDARRILAALYGGTGIVSGLAVTGGTSLSYSVAEGLAVCSRGGSDGSTLAWWPGGTTGAVEANGSSDPRVDVVWICAHDITQGDADNLVAIGVTQGTASARAEAPDIPTYATPVAEVTMPAGATTTAQATVTRLAYAIPYGASMGTLYHGHNTYNAKCDESTRWYTEFTATVTLPTSRMVELAWARCAHGNNNPSLYVKFNVDGTDVYSEEVGVDSHWVTRHASTTVELPRGSHVVRCMMRNAEKGNQIWFHYTDSNGQHFNGETFDIVDRGVAR